VSSRGIRPEAWRRSGDARPSRRSVPPIRLHVKVIPGSSRDRIDGWLGDTLKVRVAAPPERGKANAAVEALIAGALGIPSAHVRVVSGIASPRKIVEITGLPEDDVRVRLTSG